MRPDAALLQINSRRYPIKRIALINSVIARNDAVSASVRDTYKILVSAPALRVAVFAHRNDFPDVPCQVVRHSAELLLQPGYLDADVIIWHAGAYYELFNAALIGNGIARQIVIFHNTTPKEYLPESYWPDIERALRQRHHLRYVDEVWNDSVVNADVAQAVGVAKDRNRVVPLPVDAPPLGALAAKARSPIDILFVGRFVESKGVLDLITAFARLLPAGCPVRLTLAGNMQYSDPRYVDRLLSAVAKHDVSRHVVWLGTVDEETRNGDTAELYKARSWHRDLASRAAAATTSRPKKRTAPRTETSI